MKVTFKYGSQVSVIPATAANKIDRATKKDIKILILLGAHPEMLQRCESDPAGVSATFECTEAELASALAFWRGAGVIEINDGVEESLQSGAKSATAEIKAPEVSGKAKLQRSDELPKYTSEELAVLLEERKDASQLVNECQNVIGKMFNTHEVNIILGLEDYLGLDGSFILTLCAYCVGIGKKSLKYIEKTAFSLYDEGITTHGALSDYIEKSIMLRNVEGKIRTLFGMKDRELTTKEKKFIEKWTVTFGYDLDVIKRAYEKTVDAIHEPSPAYANSILERWNKEGLKTLADIEAAETDRLPSEGSFDTDDFFEAALKRSMANMQKE